MRRPHKTQSLMAEINITPFTDVILVLLIIFMITTPLIAQRGIEVKLPEASSKSTLEDPKQAYITITAEGVVYLEEKTLNTKELKQKIDELLRRDRNLKVVVAADQSCRFRDVVRVIDIVKESGVKSLNIATRTNERVSPVK
ncbi:MAG: biopolymer transporter ExbD [Candidatus Omnitrophota bacterium]